MITQLPIIAVIFPFFIACINQIIKEHNKLPRNIVLLVGSAISTLLILQITIKKTYLYTNIIFFEILPDIPLAIRIDKVGGLFALCVSFLWFCNSIYATSYMKKYKETKNFFTLITLTIFATFIVAFAANMITLFFAYEIITLTTYSLINYHKTQKSSVSSYIYLFTLLSSSILLLPPLLAYLFKLDKSILDFASTTIIENKQKYIPFFLIIAVYGFAKTAIFPLHFWLPKAMVAPTPVSALLHAVAVVKVGIFAMIRIMFFVLNKDQTTTHPFYLLTYAAGLSILFASCMALKQNNIKKRLAYSTIVQLSYILLVISVGTKQALDAAMICIIAHAFAKITLFFCAGIIQQQTGKTKINELHGIASQLPITMTCFTIATFSIIGIPPTVGFFAKYMIFKAFDGKDLILISTIFSCSAVLSALYLLPIPVYAFLKTKTDNNKYKEPDYFMLSSIIITTTVVCILGVFFLIKSIK